MKMLKQKVLYATFGLSMLVSGSAFAISHGGLITFYHLNSAIAGRDACVRMVPAIPGTGWACIYNTTPLRAQMANLLLDAYEQGKRCSIAWTKTLPEGHANISMVECGSTY